MEKGRNCDEMQGQEKEKRKKQHVVAFVVPYQGHFNPVIPFLLKMASAGIVVTFVNTEAAHAQVLKANAGKDPIIEARHSLGVDIRSVQVSDGLPLHFDRNRGRPEFWQAIRAGIIPYVEHLIEELIQQQSPPISCLLFDTFCVWSAQVAKKFNLPFASFFTQSAAAFSLFSHWRLLVQNGHLPFPDNADPNQKLIDYMPGLPPLKITDLPSTLQESDITTLLHKIILGSFDSVREAKWVLANTVDELESITISTLKDIGIPFISIGPSLPSDFMDTDRKGFPTKKISRGTSMLSETDCSSWLDSKPKEAVLYISFGSFSQSSHELLQEFAMGLMHSKVPFIWVLRPDVVEDVSAVDAVLPKEFVEGTKEQGMVVNWCSQLEVLRHPSVGGFVTHCGWNSVIEGLWSGVPMLGFPLAVDQYPNCWLISDQLGVCRGLGRVRCRRNGGASAREALPRTEVARSLVEFMADDKERCELKAEVKGVQQLMRNAVMDTNGSSRRNLELFLHGLSFLAKDNGERH